MYRVALAGGEYVEVLVEQRGIDASVTLRDPAGRPIAEFDDETGPSGQEQIDLAAETTGTYSVTVAAARGATVPGAYAIRVSERRMATGRDRSRLAAAPVDL